MLFAYRRTGPRRSALIATTQVGARAEVAAGGADQHHLQRWRVAEVIQRGIEQAHHLAGDRVELVGPVERRDQDRAVFFGQQVRGFFGHVDFLVLVITRLRARQRERSLLDRKSVVSGQIGYGRVYLGGSRLIKKK